MAHAKAFKTKLMAQGEDCFLTNLLEWVIEVKPFRPCQDVMNYLFQ